MKRLVIDDQREFDDGREAVYAKTSTEGIEALQSNPVLDELWLDHDLGWGDTIMPVINLMLEMFHNDTPFEIGTVFIHTYNPAGERGMRASMERMGYDFKRVDGIDHRLYDVEYH